MSRKYDNQPSPEYQPKSPDYLRSFFARLERLRPLDADQLADWEKHNQGTSAQLPPYKLTPCVVALCGEPLDWQVMLSRSQDSGNWQGAHQYIFEEFGLDQYASNVFRGALIVDTNQRCHLVVDVAWVLSQSEMVGSLASRYHIQKVWQSKPSLVGIIINGQSTAHFSPAATEAMVSQQVAKALFTPQQQAALNAETDPKKKGQLMQQWRGVPKKLWDDRTSE